MTVIKPRVLKRTGKRVYDVRLRDPDGKEYSQTFDTKRAAQAYEASQKTDRRRGAWVDPRLADLTVGDVAERWLASNPAKRPNALATDQSNVRKHLAVWTDRRIGSVTPPDVQGLVNSWSHLAPRTVRRQYGVLAAVFAYAVEADWLGRSPCRGVNLPAIRSTRRMKLDSEQVAAIAGATPAQYRAMVWLGAELGWRWEEVTGLRVRNLNLLTGTARVTETNIRDRRGRPVVGDPKSAASARTVALSPELVRLLADHLAARALTAADSERWVFEAPKGGPLYYSNWRLRVWLPAVAKAGCQGAGFHDLRRANATMMVANRVDLKTAQARFGHSDVRLTIGLYADALDERDRQAADLLGSLLHGPRDGRGMIREPGQRTEHQ
jgi:integrase